MGDRGGGGDGAGLRRGGGEDGPVGAGPEGDAEELFQKGEGEYDDDERPGRRRRVM